MSSEVCIFAAESEYILIYMMCGIVGCIEKRDAYPVLMQTPRRLQCRGGNSAGVALIDKKRRLNVLKVKGKNSDPKTFVSRKDVFGTVVITHCPFAAHEELYRMITHSPFSSLRNLPLIRNVIGKNHATPKEKPQTRGFVFPNGTATKVPVQFIKYFPIFNHFDLLTEIWQALHEVIGRYAPLRRDRNDSEEIIATCKSSKLPETFDRPEPLIATIPLQLPACCFGL